VVTTDLAQPNETATGVFPLEGDLKAWVSRILHRRPAIGLAVGVVRHGSFSFHAQGLAEIETNRPISQDTVFRIGSITKTMTGVAVMQLCEEGLIDLDAPANDYLRGYQLIPDEDDWQPATVRHLLTHTAGIPDVLHIRDLLHPSWGPLGSRPPLLSVEPGDPLPSLAEYYGGAIRLVNEPGRSFAYSNHGYATLGQIVEEVSGAGLADYFRDQVFDPLGMTDTDLLRSDRMRAKLAKGYVLGSSGPEPIEDREWIGGGGGGLYSSSRDLARYLAALLGGGTNEHGSILKPPTMKMMFDNQFQTDPRLPGVGLAFFRADAGGHRIVDHDGILPGFNSSLVLAPEEGVGVFGLTNGANGAMFWLQEEIGGLLHELLGVAATPARPDIPQHPEIWGDLCGRYRLPVVADLRGRVVMGGGAQVLVRGGRLLIRLLTPIPSLYGGLPLDPCDASDRYVFQLDLSRFGMRPVRLIFDRESKSGRRVIHTDLGGWPITLYELANRGRQSPMDLIEES
jgi:CubicO group peptidase (beta-lactamase class C family)